ncbi:MAG: hypothetical protein ACI4HQ_06890 [Acetatifactor sp.]
MEKKICGKIISLVAVLAAVLLVWIILGMKYDFYFVSNDDSLLEAILSGRFSGIPEARDMQHLYPLARMFTLLYEMSPSVPWYGFFLCTAQFVSLFLCIQRCVRCLESRWEKSIGGILLLFFCVGLTFYELIMVQYTITGAVMATAAIFLVITDDREEERIGEFLLHRIPCLFLYSIAFALRSEIGLFLLPFMALGCLYKWLWDTDTRDSHWDMMRIATIVICLLAAVLTHIDFFLIPACLGILVETVWCLVRLGRGRGKYLLKYFTFGICLLAAMGVLYAADLLAYRSEEWKEARAFFDERTNIYDFGKIPTYADSAEFYENLGITAEEQMLLENYNFALSDRYDSAVMESVRVHQEDYFSYLYTKEYLKKTVLDVAKRMLTFRDGAYCAALILLYVLVALGFLLKRKYSGLMMTVYALGAHMLCWCYLSWKNRLPERVTHGLYLAEIMVLTAMCLQIYCNLKKQPDGGTSGEDCVRPRVSAGKLYGIILSFSVGVMGIYGFAQSLGTVSLEYAVVQEAEQDWRAVRAYCADNPDKLYLLDTLSFASYTEHIFNERDMGERNDRFPVQNYTMCGGWTVNTPTYAQKLSMFGIKGSLYTSIISGQEMYFITENGKDVTWLKEYFATQGTEIKLQFVEQVSSGNKTKYFVYRIN